MRSTWRGGFGRLSARICGKRPFGFKGRVVLAVLLKSTQNAVKTVKAGEGGRKGEKRKSAD